MVLSMRFTKCLPAWETPDFGKILKSEIESLDGRELPLQKGLRQGSVALESEFGAMILRTWEEGGCIHVKSGVFFQGIITGCSCADDPTPVEPHHEYCELEFRIDRETGEVMVRLAD